MTTPLQFLRLRAKHLPWVVISLILLIMAGTVAIITMNLRRVVRTQIIQQDGLMLYAASLVPTADAEDNSNLTPDLKNDPDVILAEMTGIVLQASEGQAGVITARVFDDRGQVQLGEASPLSEQELVRLKKTETISSFIF